MLVVLFLAAANICSFVAVKRQMKARMARELSALNLKLEQENRLQDLKLRFVEERLRSEAQDVRSAMNKGYAFEYPRHDEVIQRTGGRADIKFSVMTVDKNPPSVELLDRNGKVIQKQRAVAGIFRGIEQGFYEMKVGAEKIDVGVGDVYLVAGQSNALSPAQKHEPAFSMTGLVSVTFPGEDSDNRFLIPTEKQPVKESVAWLYCGDELARESKVPVLFINVAVGSTSTTDWQPDKALFERLLGVLNRKKVRAVLWHQGESDHVHNFTEQESFSNLKRIIETSHRYHPEVPWIVAINSFQGMNPAVRRAQERIIQEGLALRGPDTDELRSHREWVDAGGAEFVGEGLKRHGQLWYQVLRALPE